jgi:hypothetical protein
MRKLSLLGSTLAALSLAACQDQSSPLAPVTLSDARASFEAAEAGPDRGQIGLAGLDEVLDLGDRAINPADYVCSNNSQVSGWLNDQISKSLAAEQVRFLTAYNYLAADIPTYEALYFQSSTTPQYYGADGRHTKAITKVERDLKRFWAIESANIDVVAMHGNVLIDTIRTARTYQLFGYSAAQSAGFARTLRNAIVGSTTMVDGNHPFFTFNAVAQRRIFGPATQRDTVKKIVMGDGILAVYDAIGFSDVAPEAIFAHEFGHHVQFEKGIRLTGPGITAAEVTRFGELSADAMAAYYMTHARGMALNQKRVEQFLTVFFEIGDCGFTSSGHHGTPNQRMKAAQLGFRIADGAHKQGHILSPEQFHAKFMAEYPSLIAPDAY